MQARPHARAHGIYGMLSRKRWLLASFARSCVQHVLGSAVYAHRKARAGEPASQITDKSVDSCCVGFGGGGDWDQVWAERVRESATKGDTDHSQNNISSSSNSAAEGCLLQLRADQRRRNPIHPATSYRLRTRRLSAAAVLCCVCVI